MHDAYPYLRGLIYNQPLMATPALADLADEWARAILTEGRERLSVEASAAQTKVLAPDGIKAAGVAVIPVHGALVPRGNTMTACMGTSSYDRIGAQLDAALADPEVRQIALDIDSPGGRSKARSNWRARSPRRPSPPRPSSTSTHYRRPTCWHRPATA